MRKPWARGACAAMLSIAAAAQTQTTSIARIAIDADGSVRLPAIRVPFSDLASREAQSSFAASPAELNPYYRRVHGLSIVEERQAFIERFQPALDRAKTLYAVQSNPAVMRGVHTDVVTPAAGISPGNKRRVLINLHGGGFRTGARITSALESIPVAALGRIKVVTVDYRQGPEHRFPAASEDVAAVYRELLKTYPSQNIGIYGCSAGGLLTAQATAWIQKERLPAPGAIGVLCASASGWSQGDSALLGPLLNGLEPLPASYDAPPHPEVSNATYFSEADFADPLVAPIRSDTVLGRFPPTLIISSTRDLALSAAVHTHARLTRLGVETQLNVWEGLGHAFFTNNPDLPESREAIVVIVKFFDKHLGR